MPLKLHITDGTTTIDIDNTAGNYPLHEHGYIPAIAGLREDVLGGRGIYNDVVDEIIIEVNGASAAAAYANLAALNRLLSQARQWARGDNVTAVEIQYSPDGATVSSAANPLHATILGPADGDESSGVGLSANWDEAAYNFVIPDVRIRFKRMGEWLFDGTESANSGAVTDGDLMTVTLTARNDAGPTELTLTNFPTTDLGTGLYNPGFILLTDIVSRIEIKNAEDLADAVKWTSIADAGQVPRNTNILRFTPATTVEQHPNSGSFATIPVGVSRVAVFANIRNNSNTTSFLVRLSTYTNAYSQVYTPYIYIAPYMSAAFPQWVYLGTLGRHPSFSGTWNYQLYVTASAAAGTIDFDTLVFVDVQNPNTFILGVNPGDTAANNGTLDIDHQRLTKPEPSVTISSVNDSPVVFRGDPMVYTNGASLYSVALLTGGASSRNTWRMASSVPAAVTHTLTGIRYIPYLVPQ